MKPPKFQDATSLVARTVALARWSLLGTLIFTTLAWLALTGLPRQETVLAILGVSAVTFVGAVLTARRSLSLAATLVGSTAGLLLATVLLLVLISQLG